MEPAARRRYDRERIAAIGLGSIPSTSLQYFLYASNPPKSCLVTTLSAENHQSIRCRSRLV